jgi:hypothetical protein
MMDQDTYGDQAMDGMDMEARELEGQGGGYASQYAHVFGNDGSGGMGFGPGAEEDTMSESSESSKSGSYRLSSRSIADVWQQTIQLSTHPLPLIPTLTTSLTSHPTSPTRSFDRLHRSQLKHSPLRFRLLEAEFSSHPSLHLSLRQPPKLRRLEAPTAPIAEASLDSSSAHMRTQTPASNPCTRCAPTAAPARKRHEGDWTGTSLYSRYILTLETVSCGRQ